MIAGDFVVLYNELSVSSLQDQFEASEDTLTDKDNAKIDEMIAIINKTSERGESLILLPPGWNKLPARLVIAICKRRDINIRLITAESIFLPFIYLLKVIGGSHFPG